MKRALGLFVVVCLLLPLSLQGQEQSPELQKLDYWVGEWTGTNSDGSSGTMACRWLGTFFVSCEAESPGFAVVWVMEHNAEKGYKLTSFNNSGESGTINFSVQGNAWTWPWEVPNVGQFRMVWVMESEDVLTLEAEMSEAGGEWVTQEESTMAKLHLCSCPRLPGFAASPNKRPPPEVVVFLVELAQRAMGYPPYQSVKRS